MSGNTQSGFLALELDGDGAHPAAWRKARHAPDGLLNGARIRSTVLAAESAGAMGRPAIIGIFAVSKYRPETRLRMESMFSLGAGV